MPKYTVALDVEADDILGAGEAVREFLIRVGGDPHLLDDPPDVELRVTRRPDDDGTPTPVRWTLNPQEDICDDEDCWNDLLDGEGYDGYCGEHADRREAAGVYAD